MNYRSRKIKTTKPGRAIKGLNLSPDNNDANRWFRCKHCGFINDINRAVRGDGDGRVITAYTNTNGDTDYYPVVVSGCAFCGSQNWR